MLLDAILTILTMSILIHAMADRNIRSKFMERNLIISASCQTAWLHLQRLVMRSDIGVSKFEASDGFSSLLAIVYLFTAYVLVANSNSCLYFLRI